MGQFANTLRSAFPDVKASRVGRRVATMMPTWQADAPQYPQNTRAYERLARQSYLGSEIAFAAIRATARTAATPKWVAYKTAETDAEKLDTHPALNLLRRPNAYWTRYQLLAATVTSMRIAGNAYWEVVRSKAGKVVEYWPLRPDRIRVIPDPTKYVAGYEYRLGSLQYILNPEDVYHFKDHHPLDDYYGLPPLAVLAERTDIDVWSREFTLAFFRNAGVPSGLLNIMRQVGDQERELIRQKFRQQYGGPQGWGNVLVIDNGEAKYTQMGMGPGANGLGLDGINQQSESKICSVLDVPPSVIWTVLGHTGSTGLNNASKDDDRITWWQSSLSPMYEDLAEQYSLMASVDFPDVDHFGVDLTTAPGLGKDEEAETDRALKLWQGGLATWKESRLAVGLAEEPDPDDDSMAYLPAAAIPTPWKQLADSDEAAQAEQEEQQHQQELAEARKPMMLPPGQQPPQNGQKPQTGKPPAPPAYAGNRGVPNHTGEGVSGHAETPNAGSKIKRIVDDYVVVDGCRQERFGEHWLSAETKLCVWCSAHAANVLELKYSDDQPRDDHGRWTSGGGGSSGKDAGARAIAEVPRTMGEEHASGTLQNPIYCDGDLEKAARAIFAGQHVRMDQPNQVCTLIDKMGEMGEEAVQRGERAPNYDLGLVTVPGTNLFTQASLGIPRIDMPQLVGTPVPGTPAAAMQTAPGAEVDLASEFHQELLNQGYKVTLENVPASSLRATQMDLVGPKVAGMVKGIDAGKLKPAPIFVTKDHYVIDGHHRWAANVVVDLRDNQPGKVTIPVQRINADIGTMLDLTNNYTRAMGIAANAGSVAKMLHDLIEGKSLGEGLDSAGGVFVPPEFAPRVRRKDSEQYDYQSTQVNLPADLAIAVLLWTRTTIDPNDLADGGIEDEPHVTIKYGLKKDVTADDVRRLVAGEPPVAVTFGSNIVFGLGNNGVPLVVEIQSDDLQRLHGMLKAALPNVEAYSQYRPHLTLAYLKPEAVHKYVGSSTPLAGKTVTFDRISFRNTDGEEDAGIPLGGEKLADGVWEPQPRQRKSIELPAAGPADKPFTIRRTVSRDEYGRIQSIDEQYLPFGRNGHA